MAAPLPRSLFAGSALAFALAVVGAPVRSAPQPPATDLAGQRLFLRCASCHAIAANAPAKIGPNLRGVIGRKAGSQPGYEYSPAMKAKSFVWDEATLDVWLTRPSAVVPGTSMAFAGLPKPGDRAALIAYLKKAGG